MNITPKPCIHVTSLSTDIVPTKITSGIMPTISKTTNKVYKRTTIIDIISRNVSVSYQGSVFKRFFKRVINYIERDFNMKLMTFKKSAVIRNRR